MKQVEVLHTGDEVVYMMQCGLNACCAAVQVQSTEGPGVLASPSKLVRL